VSALLTQVTSKLVGGAVSGLRGLTQGSPGGSKFTDQLSNTGNDKTIDDYFKASDDSVNTIINQPPYDPNACRNNPSLPECLPPPGSNDTTQLNCDASGNNCTLSQ